MRVYMLVSRVFALCTCVCIVYVLVSRVFALCTCWCRVCLHVYVLVSRVFACVRVGVTCVCMLLTAFRQDSSKSHHPSLSSTSILGFGPPYVTTASSSTLLLSYSPCSSPARPYTPTLLHGSRPGAPACSSRAPTPTTSLPVVYENELSVALKANARAARTRYNSCSRLRHGDVNVITPSKLTSAPGLV